MPGGEKILYLTFDDGPIPEVTPWVCEELDKYKAKATFFCIGENISRHPEIYQQVLAAGHQTGNHTYHHLNGWKVTDEEYLEDIRLTTTYCASSLFRPPYGRIKKSQSKKLTKQYRITMWDVLSYDFDAGTTPESCLRYVTEQAGPGSIVVFHDSLKAEKNLRFALPGVLEHFSSEGYRFESITG